MILVVFLFVGCRHSRGIDNHEDYFLANRNLSLTSVSMSLLATQTGCGVIIGTAEFAYKYGIYGTFYSIGLSLGLFAVSIFSAKKLREKKISTIAELFEKEYESKFLRKFTSFLSVLSLYGIFISLAVGTRKLLIAFCIENEYILYIFWGVVILHTALGGLRVIVYTDIIQMIFVFFAFILVLIYYIFYKFEYIQFSLDNLSYSIVNRERSFLYPYVIAPFLYVFIEQDMAQRLFSAKNPRIAYISAFIAGLALFVFSSLII